MINIDGKNLGELWKSKPNIFLTKGQMELMYNEINLQKQGYGISPPYNPKLTNPANEANFNKFYENYWNNVLGEPVLKNKK